MKANFIGRTENNHTAFIRIKTNQKQDSQLLVLPLEVEVTSCKCSQKSTSDTKSVYFTSDTKYVLLVTQSLFLLLEGKNF